MHALINCWCISYTIVFCEPCLRSLNFYTVCSHIGMFSLSGALVSCNTRHILDCYPGQ